MFVAFYGPDGVGKSSLIEKLRNNAHEYGYLNTYLFHFKPRFLVDRYSLSPSSKNVVLGGRPYVSSVYRPSLVLLKLIYYFIDYLLLHFF